MSLRGARFELTLCTYLYAAGRATRSSALPTRPPPQLGSGVSLMFAKSEVRKKKLGDQLLRIAKCLKTGINFLLCHWLLDQDFKAAATRISISTISTRLLNDRHYSGVCRLQRILDKDHSQKQTPDQKLRFVAKCSHTGV